MMRSGLKRSVRMGRRSTGSRLSNALRLHIDDLPTSMPKWLARATVAVAWLLAAPVAQAQNLQLWGNVTFDWVKSQRLAYGLDIEPKVLLDAPESEPGWRNLDLTSTVEFSPNPWLDLVADGAVGVTKQTDDVDSVEVTPRLGVRFHLFSRAQRFHPLERAPRRRWVVRDLFRVESRNIFYGGAGSGTSSTVRLRNRLELLVPLNKGRISDDGARTFWRTGSGSRQSTNRMSALPTSRGFAPAWDIARASSGGSSSSTCGRGLATLSRRGSAHRRTSIDLRVKRVF